MNEKERTVTCEIYGQSKRDHREVGIAGKDELGTPKRKGVHPKSATD
jgi:hypothetical protein